MTVGLLMSGSIEPSELHFIYQNQPISNNKPTRRFILSPIAYTSSVRGGICYKPINFSELGKTSLV